MSGSEDPERWGEGIGHRHGLVVGGAGAPLVPEGQVEARGPEVERELVAVQEVGPEQAYPHEARREGGCEAPRAGTRATAPAAERLEVEDGVREPGVPEVEAGEGGILAEVVSCEHDEVTNRPSNLVDFFLSREETLDSFGGDVVFDVLRVVADACSVQRLIIDVRGEDLDLVDRRAVTEIFEQAYRN